MNARRTLILGIALLVPALLLTGSAAPVSAHLLVVAPYDVRLVQEALESQAWVVLQSAVAYAADHEGRYPERVGQFTDRLPHRDLMQNVWTGETSVPSDDASTQPGAIQYRPIVWQGHRVGCSVLAVGRYGERVHLVSDLSWWRRATGSEEASMQVTSSR